MKRSRQIENNGGAAKQTRGGRQNHAKASLPMPAPPKTKRAEFETSFLPSPAGSSIAPLRLLPPAPASAPTIATASPRSMLPADVILDIARFLVPPFGTCSALDVVVSLRNFGLVCRSWNEALTGPTADEGFWRGLYLRTAPGSPRVFLQAGGSSESPRAWQAPGDEDAGKNAYSQYVCSPFSDPIASSPLATAGAGSVPSFRDLYHQRVLCAKMAGKTRRGHVDAPEDATAAAAAEEEPEPGFEYEQLSFLFELFEEDSARRGRLSELHDPERDWVNFPDDDEGNAAFAEHCRIENLKQDFLSPDVLASYASAPHFSGRANENLLWSATVRGSAASDIIGAAAPTDGDGRIRRRTTVPMDTDIYDGYSSMAERFRIVVTATRDTDGKMCQLIDLDATTAIGHDSELGNHGWQDEGGGNPWADTVVVPGLARGHADDNGKNKESGHGLTKDEDLGLMATVIIGTDLHHIRGRRGSLEDANACTMDVAIAYENFDDCTLYGGNALSDIAVMWLNPRRYDDEEDELFAKPVSKDFVVKKLSQLHWT